MSHSFNTCLRIVMYLNNPNMSFRILRYWLIPVVCLSFSMARAQDNPGYDTTYIESYKDLLTGRFYFIKKYTSLEVGAPKGKQTIYYRPNTPLSMGLGASYKAFSVNLAYGFGFLNRNKEKGKTRYIDLQTHIYGRRWTVDVFGQFYKGYYLSPRNFTFYQPDPYYLRPDLRVQLLGLAVSRVFNAKRFSYPAAFMQSEWQKKSAGSFIAGADVYYGRLRGDSALVPGPLTAEYPQQNIHNVRFIELGPGAGYAYTLVFLRNFSLTGSLTLNLDVCFVREDDGTTRQDHTDFTPNTIYRFVAGYNGRRWNINLALVNNTVSVKGAVTADHPYQVTTGNVRLTFTHRFNPGPRLTRRLRGLDGLFQNN